MESTHITNKVGLLPNYFKKVGIVIMTISILIAVIAKILHADISVATTQIIKDVLPSIFILGLFFLTWSKDKVEDELTLLIRLKAISWAFAFGILSVTVGPFIEALMIHSFRIQTSRQLIFTMLLVYLVVYYLYKRSR